MSTTTPNLNLVKPADNERALVSDINGNMDLIDSAVGDLQDSVYPKGTFIAVVTFSTVKSGTYYHAIWQLPFANDYSSVTLRNIGQVGSTTPALAVSDVTVRLMNGSLDFYTDKSTAAGLSFSMSVTLA